MGHRLVRASARVGPEFHANPVRFVLPHLAYQPRVP